MLKPDLDKKIETINQSINQIGESLKNQLVNEIKDIRSQIPQPQTQPSDEQKAEILSQPEAPLDQQQPTSMFMGIPNRNSRTSCFQADNTIIYAKTN